MSFPYYHQLDAMDYEPTYLRVVAKYYDRCENKGTELIK